MSGRPRLTDVLTIPLAIIFGSIVIGLSIILAQQPQRYEIAASVDAVGNPFLWRVDVQTGEVDTCAITTEKDDPFRKIVGGPPTGQCTKRLVPPSFWQRMLNEEVSSGRR